MFKPSSLLTVLVSVGLAAPISSFASGACVNPDFRAQKVSAVKLRHRRRQPPLKLRPLKNLMRHLFL